MVPSWLELYYVVVRKSSQRKNIALHNYEGLLHTILMYCLVNYHVKYF